MSDAEIFHRAMARYGGRLDPARLDAPTARGLEYAATITRGFLATAAKALPRLPPIYFDFVDNWDFNALAHIHEGRFLIGVCRGVPATLGLIFDRMLADPQVLPMVGNAEIELADLPLLSELGANFLHTVWDLPTFGRPQDIQRQLYASKLADIAFDFIIAHEFAHIANGHMEYTSDERGVSVIDEAEGMPGEVEAALISQTMEMDADATAVHLSLGNEWRRMAGEPCRPTETWATYYHYPGQVNLLWSWAVSSLCRIFGEARVGDADWRRESYPRWRLRSVMIQQETARVSVPESISTHAAFTSRDPDGIPMTLAVAQQDVENIFSIITGKAADKDGLNEAWGDVGRSQIKRLRDCWSQTVRGNLLRFAHQPLVGSWD